MIIKCDKCNTKYKLSESAFTRESIQVQCSKCRHIFSVEKPDTKPASPVVLGEENIHEDPVCKTITVCNQKGGVAKTSTTLNLAASLALLKQKVLVIDFDVQANLSILLGFSEAHSFFDVLHSETKDLSKHVLNTNLNFWLLPSSSKMALLSKKHLGEENYEYLLREKLEPIKKHFDYIIIDTPPSGDFYTLNALLCSDVALIPTTCEYLSMNGVGHIEDLIRVIGEKTDHKLDFRVLVTLLNRDNTASKVVLRKLKDRYNDKVMNTMIEYDPKMQESQIIQKPVFYYDRKSPSGRQYVLLAKEMMVEL